MTDTLTTGSERLTKVMLAAYGHRSDDPEDDTYRVIHACLATDPGIVALIEHAQATVTDRGPWAKRGATALKTWETGR